jgi:hypothetical protein
MIEYFRIFYRIWQIYQKPMEELVDLLGLDIPPVPQVSLAGITAESILLYWKPTEVQSVTLKYIIQVNGIKGEYSNPENAAPVLNAWTGNSWRFWPRRYLNPSYWPKASSLLQYSCHCNQSCGFFHLRSSHTITDDPLFLREFQYTTHDQ